MLKELEDYEWFPAPLRRWQMEYIGYLAGLLHLYLPLAPVMQKMIDDHGAERIQDLCSGSGMPAISLHRRLTRSVPLLLTDKYPVQFTVQDPGIAYSTQSVDLAELESAGKTVYTLFNAFHHFNPRQQTDFVKKMALGRRPFLIAEVLQPRWSDGLKVFFSGTLLQIVLVLFVKPFSLWRLLFTWILPVNLITVTYDGLISVLRSRPVAYYEKMLKGISIPGYSIVVRTVRIPAGALVCIKGEEAGT